MGILGVSPNLKRANPEYERSTKKVTQTETQEKPKVRVVVKRDSTNPPENPPAPNSQDKPEERTYAQVQEQITELATEMEVLEPRVREIREQLTDLFRQRSEIESRLFPTETPEPSKRPYTRRTDGSKSTVAQARERSQKVRDWADTQDEWKGKLKPKGPIPKEIHEAYDKAHPSS